MTWEESLINILLMIALVVIPIFSWIGWNVKKETTPTWMFLTENRETVFISLILSSLPFILGFCILQSKEQICFSSLFFIYSHADYAHQ